MESRIWGWGDYSGLSSWALKISPRVLIRGKWEGHREEDGDGGRSRGQDDMGRTQGIPQPPGAGKGRNGAFPGVPRRVSPSDTLTSAQWDWFSTSGLHNYMRINYYFHEATVFVVICYRSNRKNILLWQVLVPKCFTCSSKFKFHNNLMNNYPHFTKGKKLRYRHIVGSQIAKPGFNLKQFGSRSTTLYCLSNTKIIHSLNS